MTKVAMIIASLVMGASAWACPNIAGDYTCGLNGEQYPVTVRQAVKSGKTVYTVTAEGITKSFIADGKKRTLPDDDLAMNQKYTATCAGKSMNADLKADIVGGDGSKAGDLESTLNIVKVDARTAKVTFKGVANFNGQKNKFNDVSTCKK